MGNRADKTRCRECVYGATDARQYPCNKCTEIQTKNKRNLDYFTATNKKESVK